MTKHLLIVSGIYCIFHSGGGT